MISAALFDCDFLWCDPQPKQAFSPRTNTEKLLLLCGKHQHLDLEKSGRKLDFLKRRTLYEDGSGKLTVDPTEQFLRYSICEQSRDDWRGTTYEASLNVLLDENEVNCDAQLYRGFFLSSEHPTLILKQPETGQWFLLWVEPSGEELIPYNGSSLEEYVADNSGGNEMRIPTACLVDDSVAYSVVSAFVSFHPRPEVAHWVRWSDLEFPEEWINEGYV